MDTYLSWRSFGFWHVYEAQERSMMSKLLNVPNMSHNIVMFNLTETFLEILHTNPMAPLA